MRIIHKGATSQSLYFEVLDSSSTTGGRLTGLVFNTASLTGYYARNGAASVAITLATQTAAGAWSTGGFVAVDGTNMPGIYRLDVPDAAFASGAESVVVAIRGAANMVQTSIEVQLTGADLMDTVRLGLTALPNATVSGVGGLITAPTTANVGTVDVLQWKSGVVPAVNQTGVPIVDDKYLLGTIYATPATAGIQDINVKNINNVSTSAVTTVKAVQGLAVDGVVTTVTNQLTAAQIATGVWTDTTAGDFTTALSVGKSVMNGVSLGTGLTVASVSGAVGSVTGAVGSVTGNVGGNVVGSVGSVVGSTAQTGDVYALANGSSGFVAIKGDTSAVKASQVLATGTSTAGGAATITLQTALGADSLPNGCLIAITGGTGVGQARVITGYVNSTKVTTVGHNWTTNPDATSVYYIIYNDAPKVDSNLKVAGVVLTDTITTYTGNTVQTGDAFARIGSAGAGLTALGDTRIANLDATTSSRMATYTQPTGFLAATFPGTVASTTNISAGTITTVTNLTNAPTVGDFTATMKTSITTAATAATPTVASVSGSVGSVVGNVGGNVTGSVGSVVGAVGSVTGDVGGNVTGSVGSVTARVTANADQLGGQTVTAGAGVTFPTSVASPTNITAGTITTVTNLTNAPTAGDLTATMKTSVTTAATAATPTVSSVSGSVGSVVGAVGSVTAAVTVGTNNDKTGYSLSTSIPTAIENADALLTRDWTAIVDVPASRSVWNALRFVRNRFSLLTTPGSVDVFEEDDTTPAYSKPVTTDNTAEPIVSG